MLCTRRLDRFRSLWSRRYNAINYSARAVQCTLTLSTMHLVWLFLCPIWSKTGVCVIADFVYNLHFVAKSSFLMCIYCADDNIQLLSSTVCELGKCVEIMRTYTAWIRPTSICQKVLLFTHSPKTVWTVLKFLHQMVPLFTGSAKSDIPIIQYRNISSIWWAEKPRKREHVAPMTADQCFHSRQTVH